MFVTRNWPRCGADQSTLLRQLIGLYILFQALSGCVSLPEAPAAIAPAPAFDPFTFFVGRTEGRGQLRKILSSPVDVTVHGHGIVDEEGVLILEQDVLEGEKPPRKRIWKIHRIKNNIYHGSLSDAKGPVTISVDGNQMHIAFALNGNFLIDQHIILAADGQSARNMLEVSKLGIRVAVLEEEIVKISH